MQLNKACQIIDSLKEKDNTISFENLICWEQKEEKYSLYIFSIQLNNQDELLEIHEELRDYVAIYFQSQMLEKDVERWNIYQFFFVKDKIEDATKQKIEQDKFATRKIIYDGLNIQISDEEIKEYINQELFDFTISKRKVESITIDNYLENDNSEVLTLLKQLKGQKPKDNLNSIIKILGNV